LDRKVRPEVEERRDPPDALEELDLVGSQVLLGPQVPQVLPEIPVLLEAPDYLEVLERLVLQDLADLLGPLGHLVLLGLLVPPDLRAVSDPTEHPE